ncbi:hypothetical protein [Bifidobacterium thermophilum]|uniref:hypothetical protein n=1 Tax=Bifidobacterium thermophilum TaxID=33905 RepID=UPI00309810D2
MPQALAIGHDAHASLRRLAPWFAEYGLDSGIVSGHAHGACNSTLRSRKRISNNGMPARRPISKLTDSTGTKSWRMEGVQTVTTLPRPGGSPAASPRSARIVTRKRAADLLPPRTPFVRRYH